MQSRLLNVLLTATVGFLAGAPVQSSAQGLNVAQAPLFLRSREAPLNMLVVGRDHKLFYEAYNDASDLNFDGRLDVGYRGHLADNQGGVTYFGYFDSFKCYDYSNGVFVPARETANKRCSGNWSGDFLNYLTTARIDALRKVLYGGTRTVDTDGRTVLERARITQDAHSWGKEYTSIAEDGYDIAEFAPLQAPPAGFRHLFASTSLINTTTFPDREATPLLRVLNDSQFRVWNWLSIERPVADSTCFNATNSRVSCERLLNAGEWQIVPQSFFSGTTTMTSWRHDGNIERPLIGNGNPPNPNPARRLGAPLDRFDLNQMFNSSRGWVGSARLSLTSNSTTGNAYRCGTNNIARIVAAPNGGDNNLWAGATTPSGVCSNETYIVEYTGNIRVSAAGDYEFSLDADDAAHFELDIPGTPTNDNTTDGSRYERLVAGRYGLNAVCNCNTFNGTVTLPANTNIPFRFRFFENTGGDYWDLKLRFRVPDSRITDYVSRVEVCDSRFPEDNCKVYPNGNLKPTGLLHDYGETDTMMFGLVSGSFNNNTQGGKLRKAVSSFRNEVDSQSGRFTTARGIVYTLDRFRIVGFGGNYDYGGCSVWTRPINNGECRPWGNPMGEMLFEAMRYWAGATEATPVYANQPSSNPTDETTLGLSRATWNATTNPYAPGNFVYCAKPFNTVISDINPSYDSNLPGSAFSPAYVGSVPTPLANLNVSTLGQRIWDWEFGAGSRSVFIGEVGTLNDTAPTAKTVSSFGDIRGLSPEEPTKQGTFYSAMVAYYARVNDMSAALDPQYVQTFGVALASPLPRINFPVGNTVVTMVPFAKSGGGGSVQPDTVTPGDNPTPFAPTNQIVDFYVEQLANTDIFNQDATINDGRPYGVFRINFEDIEQGNDHDMDMILRYLLQVTADNKLFIQLTSEYAAGGVHQIGGYVISGTTRDGIYLELLDRDAAQQAYRLNTPPNRDPGYCELPRTTAVATECANMPGRNSSTLGLTAARTFEPGATTGAQLLKDPLWYMAKYGGFLEAGAPNNIPDRQDEWDTDRDGNPDNYFLVTNALRLRDQLARAFEEVLRRSAPAGAVATNSTRVDVGGLAYQSVFDSGDWSGDVKGIRINELGDSIGLNWEAKELLALRPYERRNILTTTARNNAVNFQYSQLLPAQQGLIDASPARAEAIVNWVRGDRSNEEPNGQLFRRRSSLIGDVLNSNPAVMTNQDFGYCTLPVGEGGCAVNVRGETTGPYADFLVAKADNKPTIFIGSNGGMLHAFDGSLASEGGGTELFGFVPRAVIPNLPQLAKREYEHRYYVDGSPTIGDAYLNSRWRTVLVGTTGAGGRSVFALDVTTPASVVASNVLWELTQENDPDIGLTLGRASIVKLQTGEWAAVFGNGYNSQTHRAMLFVVNLADGSLIRKYDTGVGSATEPNGLGTPTVADTEGLFGDTLAADSKGNFAYAGDMAGNMWRFDLSTNAAPVRLYRALDANGRAQHIFAAPAVQAYGGPVATGARAPRGLMVYFGTGRFFVIGDNQPQPNDPRHAFYGIRDLGNTVTVANSDLVKQDVFDTNLVRRTSQNRVDYLGGKRGFWISLDNGTLGGFTGERVVTSPVFRFGQVFFGTYAPLGGSCNPSSRGFIMAVSPFSGIGTLEALGVNTFNTSGGGNTGSGAGLYVQSSSPVPPTLLVTDRYLLALTQIDPGTSGGTGGTNGNGSNPNCRTNPTLPECVVVASSKIAIPRVSGRLSWKQLR